MTTYSLTDYATRSLRTAGLVAADEVPSAADLSLAMETIASDTAALAARRVTIWNGSEASVPEEWLAPGSRYHATTMQADFGLIGTLEAEQTKTILEKTMRAISMTPATGVVQKVENF